MQWVFETSRRAGCRRIVINGSFVTSVDEPGDVDCIILFAPDTDFDVEAIRELQAGYPSLNPHLVNEHDFEYFVDDFFSTDRNGVNKGMIEMVDD